MAKKPTKKPRSSLYFVQPNGTFKKGADGRSKGVAKPPKRKSK